MTTELIGFAKPLIFRPGRKLGRRLIPPIMLMPDRVVTDGRGHIDNLRRAVKKYGGNPANVCDLTARATIAPWNPTLIMHTMSLMRIVPCPYHAGERLTRCTLCHDTQRLAL